MRAGHGHDRRALAGPVGRQVHRKAGGRKLQRLVPGPVAARTAHRAGGCTAQGACGHHAFTARVCGDILGDTHSSRACFKSETPKGPAGRHRRSAQQCVAATDVGHGRAQGRCSHATGHAGDASVPALAHAKFTQPVRSLLVEAGHPRGDGMLCLTHTSPAQRHQRASGHVHCAGGRCNI